jgi:hypothetical protein
MTGDDLSPSDDDLPTDGGFTANLRANNINSSYQPAQADHDDDVDDVDDIDDVDGGGGLRESGNQLVKVEQHNKAQSACAVFLHDRHLKAMLSVYVLTVVSSFCYSIFLPTLPLLMTQLGTGSVVIGVAMAGYHAGLVAFGFLIVRWAEHRSLFPPLIVCCSLSIAGVLCLTRSTPTDS